MKTIDEDIKNNDFRQFYLLYGGESYLVRQYKDKLIKALAGDDTMNFSSFEGKDINCRELIDLAETLPFFSDRRTILVEDSGWGRKTPEEFGSYLDSVPETTCMIFVEEEADKRSKLYKVVSKKGRAVEFTGQTEETLARWVSSRIRKDGLNMTRDAFSIFLARTGMEMEVIDRELEKLISYSLGKEIITEKEVEAIVTDHSQMKIFDMIDSLAFGRMKQAVERYYDLIAQREPPMRILYLLTRHFHILMQAKALLNGGSGDSDIAAALGCQNWLVKKYRNQCRAFDMDRLKRAVSDGVELEEAVKTGHLEDRMAVELFLTSFAGKNEK